jgi:hypothetical protein
MLTKEEIIKQCDDLKAYSLKETEDALRISFDSFNKETKEGAEEWRKFIIALHEAIVEAIDEAMIKAIKEAEKNELWQ